MADKDNTPSYEMVTKADVGTFVVQDPNFVLDSKVANFYIFPTLYK